ncbi:MAG: response regulator [Rhodocyclaceae bacterium]|nr:response regulator [Rhodocyclaceae bacterium]MBK6909109.1 response regulator [Rhodocyclaceae bacterium]
MLKVYVVDDDAISRLTALAALEGLPVEPVEVSSGSAALAAMADSPSSEDVVLLDIEMPGIDGLEVCRRLRATGHARKTIVFLSSHDDLETRLTAYEAGGNDFIVKPADLDAVAAAVNLAVTLYEERCALAAQADRAATTAISAVASASDLWPLVEFLRSGLQLRSVSHVGQALVQAASSYGMAVLVGLRGSAGAVLSSQGECSELERSILSHAATIDRVFVMGNRMAINYPNATLVVSGLPKDDEPRVDRLRDYLSIMVEAASNRVELLGKEQRQMHQAQGIVAAVQDLSRTIDDIHESSRQLHEQTKTISDNMVCELDRHLRAVRLSDDQQAALIGLVHDGISRIAELQLRAEQTSAGLGVVTTQLKALARRP